MNWKKIALVASCILASCVSSANAETLPVSWMPQSGMKPGKVDGATLEMTTSSNGLSMEIQSNGLPPGHVVTAWWVVLQNPSECDPRPCTPKDGIGRWNKVNNVLTHAGGGVVATDGTLKLSSYLPAGQVDGNWFPTEITKPTTAEVHVILNDHGPLIPELAAEMLGSYRAGCKDESIPPIFPKTAKSDGRPGPNTCRLVQVGILVQD